MSGWKIEKKITVAKLCLIKSYRKYSNFSHTKIFYKKSAYTSLSKNTTKFPNSAWFVRLTLVFAWSYLDTVLGSKLNWQMVFPEENGLPGEDFCDFKTYCNSLIYSLSILFSISILIVRNLTVLKVKLIWAC